MRSRRSRAADISNKVRQDVKERDGGCIFCQMGMEPESPSCRLEVMHYINRSQGGLGIEENLAVGCDVHHRAMDNGLKGKRLRNRFAQYLRNRYPDWDEIEKTYSKWDY